MRRGTREYALWAIGELLIIAFALIPVLWIVSLSLKTPETVADQSFLPNEWSLANYETLFEGGIDDSPFIKPLINSIGIALITTVISIVLAAFAAYAIARLRVPRQDPDPRRRPRDRDLPADLDRRPPVRHVAGARPLRHLAGADHSLPHLLPAAGDLRA